LRVRGVRSVPVIFRGEEMIFCQSLQDVARFVGKSIDDERLPANELIARWQYFLSTAHGLIGQIPPAQLEVRPVAKRERNTCQLAYHIFQIPDSFLQARENGLRDTRVVSNAMLDHLRTVPELLAYGTAVMTRLERWWQGQADQTCSFTVQTYYGDQVASQVLERSTWHSAQHTRQLDLVLGEAIPDLRGRVDPAQYAGLPMPDGVWT
jgi:hypothetical protein